MVRGPGSNVVDRRDLWRGDCGRHGFVPCRSISRRLRGRVSLLASRLRTPMTKLQVAAVVLH